METPRDKILDILDRLGMSGVKAAEVMGLTDNTFRKNKMESVKSHNFTEKNYNSLIDFLLKEVKGIIDKIKADNVEDNFDTIIDKINYILKNKAELGKQDGWNLFDALKEIVDSMETIKAFEDMELYDQVISKIDNVVEEDINFSNLYDSYASSDKEKLHTRWFGLTKFRRIKTIDSIRNS